MAQEHVTPASTAPTFIDLFCGCGGFSLGLTRAGLRCLAAIDFNREAIEVFRANFPEVPHVLETDLHDYPPSSLAARLGINRVDVVVGGPPCQGFSTVRQVDAANHGSRVKRDKRRYLFRMFLDYVEHFQPRVFVMENVLGLQSAAKGKFFTMVQHEARQAGVAAGWDSQTAIAWVGRGKRPATASSTQMSSSSDSQRSARPCRRSVTFASSSGAAAASNGNFAAGKLIIL